jgi:hypothetical protein
MAAPACRKRVESRLNCETLEERQLLSANISASPAAEVRAFVRGWSAGKGTVALHRAASRPGPDHPGDQRGSIRDPAGHLRPQRPSDRRFTRAAVARGVNVEVIADQADYSQKPDEQAELTTLIGEGVSVHLSNSVFPQSFEKKLVIDQRQVVQLDSANSSALFV